MRTLLKTALLLAGIGILAIPAGAAEPVSVGNYGDDGSEVYYQVTCSDNTTGSVIVRKEPKEICALPAYGEETCKTAWTVESAAEKACN